MHQEFIPSFNQNIVQAGLLWPVARGESRKQLQQILPTAKIISAEQTHSNKIAIVNPQSAEIVERVDGLVTKESNLTLAIVVADCQIIIAVDEQTRVIGAAHAGWRGIYEEIGQELVKKMVEIGAQRNQIKINLSPSIQDCHFQVDGVPEEQTSLARKFKDKFGPRSIKQRGNKKFIDLSWIQTQTLVKSGILEENIFVDPRCTVCSQDQFPSHRREGRSRQENLVGYVSLM